MTKNGVSVMVMGWARGCEGTHNMHMEGWKVIFLRGAGDG